MSLAAELKELQDQRMSLHKQITDLADRQAEWGDEDRSAWETINADYDSIEERVAAKQQECEVAFRRSELAERIEKEKFTTRSEIGEAREERAVQNGSKSPSEEVRCLALQGYLMLGRSELQPQHQKAINLIQRFEQSKGFQSLWSRSRYATEGAQTWQQRADAYLSLTDAQGGYTVPQGFLAELETTLLAYGGLRQFCRILMTATGNPLEMPTMNDTGNSGSIIAESAGATAQSIGDAVRPTFGQILFGAYKFSSWAAISAELLQDSAFDLARELANALGIRLGRGMATQFAGGDGSTEPQGITVGASAGVTAAGTSNITMDELLSLQDALDPEYENMPSVGWVMNKATRTKVRQLKDSTGNYLLEPSNQVGAPDVLFGAPIRVVQDMPAMTTGLIPIVYGALEKFVVRDAGPARFYRLDELLRDSDQTGFMMHARVDSKVIQTAAIKKLTMA